MAGNLSDIQVAKLVQSDTIPRFPRKSKNRLNANQATSISFLKMLLDGIKNAGPRYGTPEMKIQKCHFFELVLKVMVCFNSETNDIFGKHSEHTIKSAKQ